MFDRYQPGDLVRKWLPEDICCIDRLESWFTDLAAEGLFLDNIGAYAAYFRKGPPRRTRYRIDVLSRELTADELALYDACGWHWVTLRREYWRMVCETLFYVFETDEDAGVPELHTDPMEQAESLRHLARASAVNFWTAFVSTALMLALAVLQAAVAAHGGRWIDTLVYGTPLFFNTGVLYVLVWLPSTVLLFRRRRSVRRLRRRLAGGEPLDHRAAYRRQWRHGAVSAGVLGGSLAAVALYLLFLFSVVLVDAERLVELPLPEGEPDFPTVRLTEVQGEPELRLLEESRRSRQETWLGSRVDWIYEAARVDGGLADLAVTCYRLPFAWGSPYVLGELVENQAGAAGGEGIRAVPLETGLVDEAWTAASGSSAHKLLLLREGRYVLRMEYFGREDLTACLPLLAQRLDAAQS